MKHGLYMTVCAVILVCSPCGARASNDGKADRSLLLGELKTYSSRDIAERACRDSLVVWADRYTGFYYDNREPKYGATSDGSYSCQADARKSGYWSTDPRDGMDGHPGRNFPFDRLSFGS